MNIQTVKDNLKKTIEGKEAYLEEVRTARSLATRAEDHALFSTQEFLKTNINELKAILKDLEQCAEIPAVEPCQTGRTERGHPGGRRTSSR